MVSADWRVVLDGIMADFACGSFPTAAMLVSNIADAAEAMQHHPGHRRPLSRPCRRDDHHACHRRPDDARRRPRPGDLRTRRRWPARRPRRAVPQAIEIAIDTMDADRIRPFWAAVLGYREQDGALVDPLRIGPPIWFQQMDEPRTDRDRFHIDVSVPHDVAEQRVAEAIAAGGTLVTDEFARSWWVLADADGNEACVCTWQDR